MRWILFIAAWTASAQTPAPDPFQASIQQQRAAAAMQRKSVQQQLDMAARYRILSHQITAPAATLAPVADCPPLSDSAVAPILETASRSQGIPVKLLRAVVQQESAFRPCAVSAKGARGLMQLMPATVDQFGLADPFDPKQNVDTGAKFLKALLNRFNGNLPQALAAYNAGPENVPASGELPDIPETRNYVESILKAIGEVMAPTPLPLPSSPASRPDPLPAQ